jgi:hypothetical protein
LAATAAATNLSSAGSEHKGAGNSEFCTMHEFNANMLRIGLRSTKGNNRFSSVPIPLIFVQNGG